jgi:TRAP-type C4-dicarboxylate transport system permease large subunit
MKRKAPYILLVIFILLLLAGIFLDEIALVLRNATTLCLDCIGIG